MRWGTAVLSRTLGRVTAVFFALLVRPPGPARQAGLPGQSSFVWLASSFDAFALVPCLRPGWYRSVAWLDKSRAARVGKAGVQMSSLDSGCVYHRLIVRADDPGTEIWLGDDLGYFVQKDTGTLDTRLLPGDYTVEFGLGTAQYPIRLTQDSSFTQAELAAGPTCIPRSPRPRARCVPFCSSLFSSGAGVHSGGVRTGAGHIRPELPGGARLDR